MKKARDVIAELFSAPDDLTQSGLEGPDLAAEVQGKTRWDAATHKPGDDGVDIRVDLVDIDGTVVQAIIRGDLDGIPRADFSGVICGIGATRKF